jgi:hypothetical protein
MTGLLPSIPTGLWPFILIAGIMVGANLYFISRIFPRKGGTPDLATIILIFGFLSMSAGLWAGLAYSVTSPGLVSTIAVFVAGNSMMAVAGAWMIGVMLRAEEKHPSPSGWLWPSLLALFFVGNEILMGLVFALMQSDGGLSGIPGTLGPLPLLTDSVVSVWFFGGMLANMVLLLLWLPVPRVERRLLLGFTVSAAAGPFVVAAPVPAAFLIRELQRGALRSSGVLRVAAAIAGALALMSLASLWAVVDPSSPGGLLAFASVSLAVMGAEVLLIARWAFQIAPVAPPVATLVAAAPAGAGSEPSPTT